MIAHASITGPAWTSLGAAVVFLVVLAALVVDRARMRRRLMAVERSEALLETDLADARREIENLRSCLRERPDVASDVTSGSGPGESGAPVA